VELPPCEHFGDAVAAVYDAQAADMFAPAVLDPTVALLAELADGGPALELGIGTGRVALPLCRQGIPVAGIDGSPAMVAQLRGKPGAEAIRVSIGDFATTRVGGSFALVYLVFNTIMNLTTQEAQVACFRNASAHLRPGGRFVLEVLVPALRRLPPGQSIVPFSATPTHLGFDEYRVAEQAVISHHYHQIDGTRWESRSVPFRYVWPSELDLMARLAGLRLQNRWADWTRAPFSAESPQHVSVWQKAEPW